ncbi:response regulator [Helicovermis profundi]|uniref:Stage 0 sporulation protein A homolog n=1 Tax=Helicovermis profundi TaxID=3065157 RepID=A0AAU9E150_9FIRM|nr:hypothetical protein HLPR_03140 [Clostridia bacterium S502]
MNTENKIKNSVLFVDDEINILKAIRRGLYKETYNMFFANSAKEALDILEKENISVIVSDMKMPIMTGLELLKIVKEKYPKIVKIILSGYTQLPQILVTINQVEIFKFITKPWDIEGDFKRIINEAIDYYNLQNENIVLRDSLIKKNNLYQKLIVSSDHKIHFFKKLISINNNISNMVISDISNSLSNMKTKEDIEYMKEKCEVSKELLTLSSDLRKFSSKSHLVEDIIIELNKEFSKLNNIFDENGDKEFEDCKVDIINEEGIEFSLNEEFYIVIYILKTIFIKLYKARFSNEFDIVLKDENYINSSETKKNDENKNDMNKDIKLIMIISSVLNKFIKSQKKLNYYLNILNYYLSYFDGSVKHIIKNEKNIIVIEMNIKRNKAVK